MKTFLCTFFIYLVHLQAFGQTYTSYFTGDTSDVSPTPKGGVCLMGDIVDPNGRLCFNKKIQNTDCQLSIANLPPSVYFVILTSENGATAHFKIVKM